MDISRGDSVTLPDDDRPAAANQPPGPGPGPGREGSARRATRPGSMLQRYALLIALCGLIIVFSALRPETFWRVDNFTTILSIQATAALLALSVTLVLLIGEFDLSVAATMGMAATLVAYLSTQQGFPVLVACAVAVLAALVVGVTNGFLVVKTGLNSFIVTLGMGTLVQGIAIGIAGSTTIGGLPQSLTYFFQSRLFGIQVAFYCMLVIAFAFYVVISWTPLGRALFFTGNARRAADLAGIRTARLRLGVLMVSSVVAGLAGVMFAGQTGAASPSIADPYLLPAYAAGFLGATAFMPGRFNVWGTVWAVYLLAVGTTGFQFLGFSNWVIGVFNGAVLILAVAASKLFARRSATP